MEPLLDPRNDETVSPGDAGGNGAARPAPRPAKCVCPFCGTIHNRSETACPKCRQENNAGNRNAARTRAGTWSVLDPANPTVPGMKWQVLLDSVARGQVTVRTIVRGPSTNQLWRFAGRTRGLSREFGICYGCGKPILATTEICPECQRWQLPPSDPDALMDNAETATVQPVFRQVAAPIETPAPAAPPVAVAAPTIPDPASPTPEPAPPVSPASPILPESPQTPMDRSRPPSRQQPPRGILTPKELAAAFSLEYPMGRAPRQKRRLGIKRTVTAVLAFSAVVYIGLLCFVQPVRDALPEWAKGFLGLTTSQPRFNADRQMPDSESPFSPPAAPAPVKPFELPPVAVNNPPIPAPAVTPQTPTAGQTPPSPPSSPPAPRPSVVTPPTPPSPVAAAHPATPPVTPDPPASPAADTADPEQQIDLAMALFSNAIDAEAANDYPAAVWYYEKIKAGVPKEDWPVGLEIRLQAARRHVIQDNLAASVPKTARSAQKPNP